jgi:methionyl-tRNA formyltransferase
MMGSKAGGLALAQLLCELGAPVRPVLVLCPDDRADPRSCFAQFKLLCHAHDVPLRFALDSAEVQSELVAIGPAVVLVHGWYRLIPLQQFSDCEFFGFHYSPLPAYRGSAPLVWQILRGERRLGISFFRFGAGMDDGDLVAQERFDLGTDETIADALERANALMLKIARTTLPALLDGRQPLVQQPAEGASYCGLRLPEDGCVDWTQPAHRLHDFVRAQTRPYPGAYTALPGGRILRIWRSVVDGRRMFGDPGAVLAVERSDVVVACGDESALRVLDCSVDDGPSTAPAGVVGSLRMRLGCRWPSSKC